MTDHPNYKYRPRRRKHTKPRAGPQSNGNAAAAAAAANAANNSNNSNNNNSASNVQLSSNNTPSSTPSTRNQSSSSEVQYERNMSPYNYNGMYYNDGSTLTSPGQSSPSPSPPNSAHSAKKLASYKMEDNAPTPAMSPMEMGENIHSSSSSKIDYEQALPATTTTTYSNASNKNRYGYDTSSSTGYDGHYVSTSSERHYEEQMAHHHHHQQMDKKAQQQQQQQQQQNQYSMPLASTPSTTIAAMGNGMYVMCSNRGVLDQGHVVTGTYFPPLPSSQDHQNLGGNSILTSASHHHHQQQQQHLQHAHYMNSSANQQQQQQQQVDVKYKINDSNNNKHGSENNNSKASGKGESNGKSFKAYKDSSKGAAASKAGDDIDDKLIKNDSNNNNSHPDNKNHNSPGSGGGKMGDMSQNINRLVLSSPTSAAALSPYHHQSYLSQYKNHINYGDQAALQQQQMQEEIAEASKYNNFAANAAAAAGEYDPYQSNPIYYHPTTHFTHSHALPPPSPASPATFYVTNPEYYHHQPYAMSAAPSNGPTGGGNATLVQPMVTKIDAVIGATLHHPPQNLIAADAYAGAPEPLKEDDFSNILAGVRKTCYSN
jgi:transcription factor SOX7/8/10/18 (SOX group E/F)